MVATPSAQREQLICEHMDFARALAGRMALRLPFCVELEDLQADAYLGLVKAADGFDPARQTSFRTYAGVRINGAMLDGLRQRQLGTRGHRQPTPQSLDLPAYGPDGRPETIADQVASADPPVGSRLENLDEAEHAMRHWQARYRDTLSESVLHDLSQKRLAEKLGISQSAVSQRMSTIRRMILASREPSLN